MPLRLTFACLLAAALLAGCGEKEEPDLADIPSVPSEQLPITGEWRGELTQRGLRPFEVRATIASASDPSANVVRYSGIDCSGTWEYLGRAAEAYRFREVIDAGDGGECKGVGTVTLVPAAGDRLDYEFTGGGVESSGVLEPVR